MIADREAKAVEAAQHTKHQSELAQARVDHAEYRSLLAQGRIEMLERESYDA